jgi:hypothetical protein
MRKLFGILLAASLLACPFNGWAADTKISADTTKTAPVGADLIPILDSAASNANKKVTVQSLRLFPYASLTAGQYEGPTRAGVCGETLVAGNAVYLGATGRLWKAKADSTSTMPAIGIVVSVSGGGLAGQACVILTSGYINTGTYTAATAPVPIYVSRATAGLITITAPSTVGDQVQILGYVTDVANILAININEALFEVGSGETLQEPAADGTYGVGSLVISGINGEAGAMALGDVVFIANGATNTVPTFKFAKGNAASDKLIPAVAMCTGTVAAGATGTFLLRGTIQNTGWSALTVGGTDGIVWLSVTGTTGNTWNQTAPASNKVQQRLGYAVNDAYSAAHTGQSKSMYFCPSGDWSVVP